MRELPGGIVGSIRFLHEDRLIDRRKHGQVIGTVADPDGVETALRGRKLTATTLYEKSTGRSFVV